MMICLVHCREVTQAQLAMADPSREPDGAAIQRRRRIGQTACDQCWGTIPLESEHSHLLGIAVLYRKRSVNRDVFRTDAKPRRNDVQRLRMRFVGLVALDAGDCLRSDLKQANKKFENVDFLIEYLY